MDLRKQGKTPGNTERGLAANATAVCVLLLVGTLAASTGISRRASTPNPVTHERIGGFASPLGGGFKQDLPAVFFFSFVFLWFICHSLLI